MQCAHTEYACGVRIQNMRAVCIYRICVRCAYKKLFSRKNLKTDNLILNSGGSRFFPELISINCTMIVHKNKIAKSMRRLK